MALLKETSQVLDDLERGGFDVTSLRRQAQVPVLEARANEILGKGILRQDVFTRNSQQRADRVKELERQVAELQALATAGADQNGAAYQAALGVIQQQQQLLLNAGFSEEEVSALSEEAIKKATTTPPPSPQQLNPVQPNPTQSQNSGATTMQDKNYLDLDTYQKQAVDQVFGNAAISARITRALTRAQGLGVEVPNEKIDNIGMSLRTAIEAGKDIDGFLHEEFGITAKEKENAETARKKEVEDAYVRGKSEGLKESGTPRRAVSRTEKHPIYDNVVKTKSEVPNPDENGSGNKDIPRNKWGDPEIYRTRGNAQDRIASAAAYHEKVLDRTEQQNSIPSE